MEVIILGASGQVGKALMQVFPDARAMTRAGCDLAKAEDIEKLRLTSETVLINAAAYTQVDNAETEEGKQVAWNINAAAVIALAQKCKKSDAIFVHFSTDYVFDGTKTEPYTETDSPKPLSEYGSSKAAGDDGALSYEKSYVLRTSGVYGDGKNFVNAILGASETRDELNVVADQFMRPTYAKDIAEAVKVLLENKAPFGLYNCTNSGPTTTWADFAREVFKLTKKSTKVVDTTAEEYFRNKTPHAIRPKNSTLDIAKLEKAGVHMRTWQGALQDFLGAT